MIGLKLDRSASHIATPGPQTGIGDTFRNARFKTVTQAQSAPEPNLTSIQSVPRLFLIMIRRTTAAFVVQRIIAGGVLASGGRVKW